MCSKLVSPLQFQCNNNKRQQYHNMSLYTCWDWFPFHGLLFKPHVFRMGCLFPFFSLSRFISFIIIATSSKIQEIWTGDDQKSRNNCIANWKLQSIFSFWIKRVLFAVNNYKTKNQIVINNYSTKVTQYKRALLNVFKNHHTMFFNLNSSFERE